MRREADPADKRVTLVRVTDEGRRTIAAIRDRKDLWLATRLDELPSADLARLAAALDVLEELSAPTEPRRAARRRPGPCAPYRRGQPGVGCAHATRTRCGPARRRCRGAARAPARRRCCAARRPCRRRW